MANSVKDICPQLFKNTVENLNRYIEVIRSTSKVISLLIGVKKDLKRMSAAELRSTAPKLNEFFVSEIRKKIEECNQSLHAPECLC